MLKKSIIIIISTLSVAFEGMSQIVVTNTQTPANIVQNVLLGNGVTAMNIKYNGSLVNSGTVQQNVSSFTSGATNFPFVDGVLLTTGNCSVAVGPNGSAGETNIGTTTDLTDADLSLIAAPTSITNGASIEFDFVATGNMVSFQYIFASEEYPEFAPSTYNDAFGFFLSGPGLSGIYSNSGVNLATLPSTVTSSSNVTINNVNPDSNAVYYVNNNTSIAYGTAIEYDGTTVVLTASAPVVCGQTYHIKLAVTNVGDHSLDSGVFLKGGSFSSNPINVQATTSTGIPIDSVTIEEGCSSIDILFTRPVSFIDSSQVFDIVTYGDIDTALDLSNFVDSVYFAIGVDSVMITYTPVNDGIVEPMELLQIMVFSVTACGDTLYDSVQIYIVDQLTVDFTTTPATACNPDGSATALAVGNIGTPVYAWTGPGPDNTDTVNTAIYNNISSGWYYMTLSDNQCEIYDSVFVDQLNPPISSFTSGTSVGSAPAAFMFTNTSQNATSYFWDFGNSTTAVANDLSSQTAVYPTSGTYTIMLVAYLGLCTDTSYLQVQVLDLPTAEGPNVFTPNGDGDNDFFSIITSNVANVDLIITNRWGNTVFESSGANPVWDGKADGKLADSATYFYIYTATGVNGDVLKGQGFIQLIRE